MNFSLKKLCGLRVAEGQEKGYTVNGSVKDLVADEDMQKIFEMRIEIRNDTVKLLLSDNPGKQVFSPQ